MATGFSQKMWTPLSTASTNCGTEDGRRAEADDVDAAVEQLSVRLEADEATLGAALDLPLVHVAATLGILLLHRVGDVLEAWIDAAREGVGG
ncbi:MAG: hypothetical protein U0575_04405 [Phycisphaerales bacterium]